MMCDQIGKYFGDHHLAEGESSFTVYHGLNTAYPIVQIVNSNGGHVHFSMKVLNEAKVQIWPAYSPDGEYRVVILG